MSLFCRIFFNTTNSSIKKTLNTHAIITNCQYGFLIHHSTELTAIQLIDGTTSELYHHKIPFSIYIDMSKAFDLIDFTVLLHKLSHYGIHDTALKLLKSYLTHRKQYCYYKGDCSNTLTPTRDVPQDAILGPLLFQLYINDFLNVTNKFQFLMYADDTTLHSTYDTFHDTDNTDITTITHNISTELSRIVTWLTQNKLLINTSKTKMAVFHRPHKYVI